MRKAISPTTAAKAACASQRMAVERSGRRGRRRRLGAGLRHQPLPGNVTGARPLKLGRGVPGGCSRRHDPVPIAKQPEDFGHQRFFFSAGHAHGREEGQLGLVLLVEEVQRVQKQRGRHPGGPAQRQGHCGSTPARAAARTTPGRAGSSRGSAASRSGIVVTGISISSRPSTPSGRV